MEHQNNEEEEAEKGGKEGAEASPEAAKAGLLVGVATKKSMLRQDADPNISSKRPQKSSPPVAEKPKDDDEEF